jgi:hypothetical protein
MHPTSKLFFKFIGVIDYLDVDNIRQNMRLSSNTYLIILVKNWFLYIRPNHISRNL